MMSKESEQTEKYAKGFNDGYILSKYSAELAEKLSSIKSDNIRMEGFKDGRQEFLSEKAHYPQWLKRDFTLGIDQKGKEDKSIDRDI